MSGSHSALRPPQRPRMHLQGRPRAQTNMVPRANTVRLRAKMAAVVCLAGLSKAECLFPGRACGEAGDGAIQVLSQ